MFDTCVLLLEELEEDINENGGAVFYVGRIFFSKNNDFVFQKWWLLLVEPYLMI